MEKSKIRIIMECNDQMNMLNKTEPKVYTAINKLSKIGIIQEAAEIEYSATYETDKCCTISVSKSKSNYRSTEKFKCNISFEDCIGLITLFKENCLCPEHCKDVASDLGYITHAI